MVARHDWRPQVAVASSCGDVLGLRPGGASYLDRHGRAQEKLPLLDVVGFVERHEGHLKH